MSFVRLFRIFRTESFRLAAGLAGLFVVSSLILMISMYQVTQTALDADFLQSVQGDIGAVEDAYRSEGRSEVIEVLRQLTASPQPFSYYLLQDKDGNKLAGNLPQMSPVYEPTLVPAPEGVPNRKEHAVYGQGKLLSDGSYVFVGADSHQLIEAREHIFFIFGLITLLTTITAIGGGVLLSAGAVRRIDNVIEVCRAIASNRWDKRIPVDGSRAETNLLAGTINSMLDRLAALMENLRQVSSDIAHDLRTPLTHMRQRLERAQLEAKTAEEYMAAMERALSDSDGILAIFTALLNLSQIEAGARSVASEVVDLAELLHHLAETYQPVAADHKQSLVAILAPKAEIRGDRALLLQMFSNLVENAIRHCPAGTAITLDLDILPESILVRVMDSGPGIPVADRHRVFDRFWRGEASRTTRGHGLGLALVSAVAKVHLIKITLADNEPGLIVELAIPHAAISA